MYNNTTRIVPYVTSLITGVILPHSDNVLNAQNLEKKILKARAHINHLTAKTPNKGSHGGKRFRAKRISIQNQISDASQRLNVLQMAKAAILKLQPRASMLKTTARIAGASELFVGKSSSVFFAGKQRNITVLHARY